MGIYFSRGDHHPSDTACNIEPGGSWGDAAPSQGGWAFLFPAPVVPLHMLWVTFGQSAGAMEHQCGLANVCAHVLVASSSRSHMEACGMWVYTCGMPAPMMAPSRGCGLASARPLRRANTKLALSQQGAVQHRWDWRGGAWMGLRWMLASPISVRAL